MVLIVHSTEAILTLDAVDSQFRTLLVVVLAYLIPRRQFLVAMVTEVMRQLVLVELFIRYDLAALSTLDLYFVKDSRSNSIHWSKCYRLLTAVFVGTFSWSESLLLDNASATEALLALAALFSISD